MRQRDKVRVRFAGYAAVFDAIDRGGDVIRPGAFGRTLKSGEPVPLLWQHRGGDVVGRIEELREDKRGLRVIGSLNSETADAVLGKKIRKRLIDGLSFGYQVRQFKQANGVRELIHLDLVEVSVVARPMQPLARIHAVEG
jgi:HK97 family phage prohead protease